MCTACIISFVGWSCQSVDRNLLDTASHRPRDILGWREEKGNGPVKGKGQGEGKEKGKSKGKGNLSTDQETRANERLAEKQRRLEHFGMWRHRSHLVGHYTKHDQIFVFALTTRRDAITDLHMRNSILSSVQADDGPNC